MEVVTEYADHKTELEGRIEALEAEQASLIADISTLKEKLTTLELERHASSLASDVEALRTEKTIRFNGTSIPSLRALPSLF